jgi:hypothetical protein
MPAQQGPKPGEDVSRDRRITQVAREQVMLDRRYGAIGISAVAAAARYAGGAKNPAYAHSPVTARLAARLDDLSVA